LLLEGASMWSVFDDEAGEDATAATDADDLDLLLPDLLSLRLVFLFRLLAVAMWSADEDCMANGSGVGCHDDDQVEIDDDDDDDDDGSDDVE